MQKSQKFFVFTVQKATKRIKSPNSPQVDAPKSTNKKQFTTELRSFYLATNFHSPTLPFQSKNMLRTNTDHTKYTLINQKHKPTITIFEIFN